jgi:ABC-2 type transport system ATP-binding protein
MDIVLNNLQKKYGEQIALNIEELVIRKRELAGILGNNGAGKTTMFRLLLDLIEPSQGQALINGTAVTGSHHWKLLTGSYLDEGFLIDFMTPEEYFHFTGKLYGISKKETEQRLSEFERFMSGEILGQKKYIRNLSTGNKQKVGIIAAMLARPELLILDEPFNYLDPTSQILIKRMLKQENETHGTTMLISSHNLNHITEICSRVILLEKGRVIKDLSLAETDFSELASYFEVNAG